MPAKITASLIFALSAIAIGRHASGEEQPAESRIVRGLVYARHNGSEPGLTSLDVYAPASGKNLPVMIWIHGGGWRIGDKLLVQTKPQAFVEKGFVFVSINYRLHPAATYKEQAADVAAAIRWVQEHAAQYGGSPERIYLMGHSAGAHLAALVAIDRRYLEAEKLGLSAIRGVVLLDGAGYDVARQIESAQLPWLKDLYKTVFTEDEEVQKDASPIHHVEQDQGIPPFLILYVASRRDAKMQSEGLAAKLTRSGASARAIAVQDKTHATISRHFGREGDPPTALVFDFLDRLEK